MSPSRRPIIATPPRASNNSSSDSSSDWTGGNGRTCRQLLRRRALLAYRPDRLNSLLLVLLGVDFGDGGAVVAEDDTGGFDAELLP